MFVVFSCLLGIIVCFSRCFYVLCCVCVWFNVMLLLLMCFVFFCARLYCSFLCLLFFVANSLLRLFLFVFLMLC